VRNIFMTMLTKIQHFCMRYRELQKFRWASACCQGS
jgi:hypothetical protein